MGLTPRIADPVEVTVAVGAAGRGSTTSRSGVGVALFLRLIRSRRQLAERRDEVD